MICDNCGKKATYFLTENVNGFVTEKHLCCDCLSKAEKQGYEKQISVGNFLDTFSSSNIEKYEKVCNVCESTYEDVVGSGFVGCSHCYEVFSQYLKPLINKIQGSLKHVGKKPNLNQSEKEGEIIRLNHELEVAVKEKRFNDAAEIFNQIKLLEGKTFG